MTNCQNFYRYNMQKARFFYSLSFIFNGLFFSYLCGFFALLYCVVYVNWWSALPKKYYIVLYIVHIADFDGVSCAILWGAWCFYWWVICSVTFIVIFSFGLWFFFFNTSFFFHHHRLLTWMEIIVQSFESFYLFYVFLIVILFRFLWISNNFFCMNLTKFDQYV